MTLEGKQPNHESIDIAAERRAFGFLNGLRGTADLAHLDLEPEQRHALIGFIDRRDRTFPLGMRSAEEAHRLLDAKLLDLIIGFFGPRRYGRWQVLPYGTQHPDGTTYVAAHAALLRTGKVIFLPSWDPMDTVDTVVWDPSDLVNPQFTYPNPQPSDFLFCSGHAFLSDGRLLVVGGGGNFISNAIRSGWKFDPMQERWDRTAGDMAHARWYPTAVTLDKRRVFIASGYGITACEIYDETSDTFATLTGPPGDPTAADHNFPETYPGLHLLPGGWLFYSRTGWHGPNDIGTNPLYFKFTGPLQGRWDNAIGPDPMTHPDRTEGMSVLLIDPCGGASVLIVCGGLPDPGGRATAELVHLNGPTPIWHHPMHLPDARLNVNAVLLPDGTVFVSGGIATQNSPCLLIDPTTHQQQPMDELTYRREYHSMALLLPDGRVMTTGGDYGNSTMQKTSIEIFSPPYLFRGPRPTITNIPAMVHHGQEFDIDSSDAPSIAKVVMVRPMAVTHQTDSEQRVIPLHFRAHGHHLHVHAPHGPNAHRIAPKGYYLLFVLNDRGVPSVGSFVRFA